MDIITDLINGFRQLNKIADGFCVTETSLQSFQLPFRFRVFALVILQGDNVFTFRYRQYVEFIVQDQAVIARAER